MYFEKKKSSRVKGGEGMELDTFMFAKKFHQKIYKYASYILSKSFSNLLLGLHVKPKSIIITFFLIPTMPEIALEALILLMYL